MTSKAGGNADDLVSSQLSLSPSYLPQLGPLRSIVSVSHEYIINITIHCSYIFLITLVLQSIMTLEPLELVLCRENELSLLSL